MHTNAEVRPALAIGRPHSATARRRGGPTQRSGLRGGAHTQWRPGSDGECCPPASEEDLQLFLEHLERGITYNFRRTYNLMHMIIRLSTCACDKVYMVFLIELPYLCHLVISWAVERACLPNLNFVACKCLL